MNHAPTSEYLVLKALFPEKIRRFCVFLRLVYPVLPVSLDCPFFTAHSVFSNVYLRISYEQPTPEDISLDKMNPKYHI